VCDIVNNVNVHRFTELVLPIILILFAQIMLDTRYYTESIEAQAEILQNQ